MRNYTSPIRDNILMDYVMRKMAADRMLSWMVSACFTMATVLSLIAGITLWPVLFLMHNSNTSLTQIVAAICTWGIVSLLVDLVLAITMMIWRREGFSFIRCMFFNLAIDWFILLIVLLTHNSILDVFQVNSFVGDVMWFTVSIFLSYILSILPAVLTSFLTKLTYDILNLILPE